MQARTLLAHALLGAALLWTGPAHAQIDANAINSAEWRAGNTRGDKALRAKVQILLDRAHFSPGVIDGENGENTRFAVAAFKERHSLGEGQELDEATWRKLNEGSSEPVIQEYEITQNDVKGPFVDEIPEKLEDKAELKHLGYTSPLELLAEKFHMDGDLLKALNPKADFASAGTRIFVASVERETPKKAKRVTVDKSQKAVLVFGADDELLAYYPATIGSETQPAPDGKFKIINVVRRPVYTYDPRKLSFKGVKAEKPFKVAPGPNNPVGLVWIGIDKEGYGIHGAPDPSKVGKTSSHGCVRLTNWDVLALAGMVAKGVPVEFVE